MAKTKYEWAEGSRMTGDAELAAKVCKELEAKGSFSAEELVDASEAEDAPLHDMFEWNDTIAARKYRIEQAKKIIRSIVVVMDDKPVRYREFSSVSSKTYMSTMTALSSERTREILLNSAKTEMERFKAKYKTLTELAGVFDAIDSVLSEVA